MARPRKNDYERKNFEAPILIEGEKYVTVKVMAQRVGFVIPHLRQLARERGEAICARKRGRRWYFHNEKTEKAIEKLYDGKRKEDILEGL